MRWHADDSQRRRSANADILESLGLPTTGSYKDMKSLQQDEHAVGGMACCWDNNSNSSSGGCLRAAVAAFTSTSQAVSSSALRWTKKMTPQAVCRKKRQTRQMRQTRKVLDAKNACWLCESEAESLREHEHGSSSLLYTSEPNLSIHNENPVAVSPGQWLRQRGARLVN